MKPLHEKVKSVLSEAYCGLHHVPGKIKASPHKIPIGYEVNVLHDLATCDTNVLTILVIRCHEECVRMTIRASGPQMLKLFFTDRKTYEEGGLMDGHPTLAQVMERRGK